MTVMDDNDFYEDDEPIEDVRAAWKRGERGMTGGERDLNRRAKSIVDRAVQQWEAPSEPAHTVIVQDAATWFSDPGSRKLEVMETTTPTPV
jgi:hypothetical protein